MEFPTIFYKTPGKFSGNGGTYDTIGVEDKDQAEKLKAEGWKASYAEICDPKSDKIASLSQAKK